MKKITTRLKKRAIILTLILGGIGIGANVAEDYFEISKNLEIFSDLYKKVNIYYSDDTKPGELMKVGVDAMLKSLDPYTVSMIRSLLLIHSKGFQLKKPGWRLEMFSKKLMESRLIKWIKNKFLSY